MQEFVSCLFLRLDQVQLIGELLVLIVMFCLDLSNLFLVTFSGLLELILKPRDGLLQLDVLSISLLFFFLGLLLISSKMVLRFV